MTPLVMPCPQLQTVSSRKAARKNGLWLSVRNVFLALSSRAQPRDLVFPSQRIGLIFLRRLTAKTHFFAAGFFVLAPVFALAAA